MSGTEQFIFVTAFILVGGLVFVMGFVTMRKYRIIRDTPRSKIRSMAMGIVEIHGSVEADQLIKSPFSKTDCVYYKFEILEYRKSSSSKGKKSTYEWRKVSSGERWVPFFAVDETGKALVEPDKAEFEVSFKKGFYQKTKGIFGSFKGISNIIKTLKSWDPTDPASLDTSEWELEPLSSRSGSRSPKVGDRKYNEFYIEPGDTLFVLGTAVHQPDAPDNVVIRRGKNEKTFIIADKSEKSVLKKLKSTMVISFIAGGIFFAAGIVMLLMFTGIIPGG